MNKSQLIVLWIGIAGFVLVGLNPHWTKGPERTGRSLKTREIVYRPPEYKFCWGPESMEKLLVGWGAVVVVTGGLICTLGVHPDLMQKIQKIWQKSKFRKFLLEPVQEQQQSERTPVAKATPQSSPGDAVQFRDNLKVVAFCSAIVGLIIGVTIAAVSITAISQRYDELQRLTAKQVDTVKIRFIPDDYVLDKPAPDIFDRVSLEEQVKKDLWIELPDCYFSVRGLLVGISAPLAGFFGAWLITWLVGSLFTRPRLLVNRR